MRSTATSGSFGSETRDVGPGLILPSPGLCRISRADLEQAIVSLAASAQKVRGWLVCLWGQDLTRHAGYTRATVRACVEALGQGNPRLRAAWAPLLGALGGVAGAVDEIDGCEAQLLQILELAIRDPKILEDQSGRARLRWVAAARQAAAILDRQDRNAFARPATGLSSADPASYR